VVDVSEIVISLTQFILVSELKSIILVAAALAAFVEVSSSLSLTFNFTRTHFEYTEAVLDSFHLSK